MDEHAVSRHVVTMHLSKMTDPAHSHRYDADPIGGAPIVESLYLNKKATAGKLVKDTAPKRIRVTMIIETLEP